MKKFIDTVDQGPLDSYAAARHEMMRNEQLKKEKME